MQALFGARTTPPPLFSHFRRVCSDNSLDEIASNEMMTSLDPSLDTSFRATPRATPPPLFRSDSRLRNAERPNEELAAMEEDNVLSEAARKRKNHLRMAQLEAELKAKESAVVRVSPEANGRSSPRRASL